MFTGGQFQEAHTDENKLHSLLPHCPDCPGSVQAEQDLSLRESDLSLDYDCLLYDFFFLSK